MITDYIRYLETCAALIWDLSLYDGYAHEPETMAWVSQYSNANMIKTTTF